MHIYYVAGLPYSDDLYHSGTKGMKWGRRLYQYEDGTLTPLGKIHYAAMRGAKATGKAIGKATKKVGTHIVDKFKDNHKWMMSDEELDRKIARATKEKQYKDLLAANKKTVSRGKRVSADILEGGAKTLGSKAFNSLASLIFDKKEPPKVSNWEDVMKNPKKYSDKDVLEASNRLMNLNKMNTTAKMLGKSQYERAKVDTGRQAVRQIIKYGEQNNSDWGKKKSRTIFDF